MGVLRDAAKIARSPIVIDVIDAAVMSVALEVEDQIVEPGDPNYFRNQEHLALARRMIEEIQGELSRSYMTRLMWLVALDSTVRSTGLLKADGTIDPTKLDNDDAVLTVVRRLLVRMIPG